ncbi:hypothetical protein QEH56_16050 [Pelagicoccus enzymogenes]|uniref:hypothetical protein n=1 Tax=Pelagicoccus enzymogenes TaxID=2773457 RepID=UPI00280F3AC4|nr:hypothetical protein [Pelagicoccus enzymogenes]MDQ8199675.1 hypothetical protein [Pelagicoccus enzymogenes]
MASKTINIRLSGPSLKAAEEYANTHGVSIPVAVKRLYEQRVAKQLNLPVTTLKVCDPESKAFQAALSGIKDLEKTLDDSYEGVSRAYPGIEAEIEDWRKLRKQASDSLMLVSLHVGQMVNLVGLLESSMGPAQLAKKIRAMDKGELSKTELENLLRLFIGRNFSSNLGMGDQENAD